MQKLHRQAKVYYSPIIGQYKNKKIKGGNMKKQSGVKRALNIQRKLKSDILENWKRAESGKRELIERHLKTVNKEIRRLEKEELINKRRRQK